MKRKTIKSVEIVRLKTNANKTVRATNESTHATKNISFYTKDKNISFYTKISIFFFTQDDTSKVKLWETINHGIIKIDNLRFMLFVMSYILSK